MTLDRRASLELQRPAESVADLVAYLRTGEKPPASWRVGIEHEKLALRGDGQPVPYQGERGIETLLRRLADADGWKPVSEGAHVIALEKEQSAVTLEPGAQVELDGTPVRSVHQAWAELEAHVERLKRVSQSFDVVWIGLGLQPFGDLESMPRVPRERYRIMRAYLPQRGELALEMMHCTASVQASFDYADEADMVAKMRAALAATPVVAALYANSSLSAGQPNGFVSRRLHIWSHSDPDRTGLLPLVFEPDFGYRAYAEWALDVPMFFIVRDGHYRNLGGKTFRRFLREGHEGERATLADFERHLTTLFPHARLKRILEVRCADAVPRALAASIPALWKGLLYDAAAREAVTRRLAGWSPQQRDAVLDQVARRGLAADTPEGGLLPLAGEVVDIADQGLRRIADRDASGRDERVFLEPLRAQLELGQSPGEVVRERWDGDWRRSVARLIDYARY